MNVAISVPANRSLQAVFWFVSMEKCCQSQLMAEAAAGSRGEKPVAIGADQAVGPDDFVSIYGASPKSMSRRTSAGPAQAKVYVEFCMQTSPQPSPTESNFPVSDSLTVDDAACLVDADQGNGRSWYLH